MLSGTLRREHPQPKHPTVEISTVDKSNGTRTLDGEHSINIPRYENTGSAHIKSGIAPSVTSSGVTYRRDCEQGNIWVDVLTAKTTRILYVVYASVPIEHRSDAQATLESIVKTFAVTSDLTIEQYRKVLRANIEAHPPNPAVLAVTPTYIAEKASDVWRSGRREEAITMFCRINEIDDRQTLAAFGIGMRESERPGEEKEAIQELTYYSTNTTDGKSTDGRERLSLARATLNRLLHGATSR